MFLHAHIHTYSNITSTKSIVIFVQIPHISCAYIVFELARKIKGIRHSKANLNVNTHQFSYSNVTGTITISS